MFQTISNRLVLTLLAATASLHLASAASAEEHEMSINGFASFAYAKTLDDKEGGVGEISNDGELRDFSRMGIRINQPLQDGLSFTFQLTAHGDEDYEPELDQAFLDIDLNASTLLTIGKIRPPVFLYSNALDVGHAYPWVMPPDAVYDPTLNPFKSLEGVKLQYVSEMGDYWTSELVVFAGSTKDPFVVADVGLDSELTVDNGHGLSWQVNYKWLTLRALYFAADTSTDITSNPALSALIFGADPNDPGDGQIEGLSLLVSQAAGYSVSFVDDFLWEKDPSTYLALGAMLDFEQWFAIMEATRIDVDTNIAAPRQDSYYLTLGYRLPADLTLYGMFAVDNNTATEQVWKQFDRYIGTDGALNGALDGTLAPAREGIRTQVKQLQDYDIKYLNLGTRWDMTPSTSLKLELMYREYRNFNFSLGRKLEREPLALRIGLDLVF